MHIQLEIVSSIALFKSQKWLEGNLSPSQADDVLIGLEIESSSALFNNQRWLEELLSLNIISPSTSNQNFEVAILSSIFENSSNYVFGWQPVPYNPQGKCYRLYQLPIVII